MDSEVESPSEKAAPPGKPAWLLWARGLLLVATLGACYLAWVSIHNGPLAGCGPESGCNKVLQSRWAYWLDFPVSIPAVLVYLALIGGTVLLQKRAGPDDQRGSWAAIIVLSVIVAGSALWFIGLQVFVIKAFCKFCMTAHACGLTAAILCLKNIPWAEDPATPMWSTGSGKRGVPRSAMGTLIPVGLAGVALLAGGQLLFQKERNLVKVLKPVAAAAANGGANSMAPGQAGQGFSQPPTPELHRIAPRLVSLYGKEFLVNLEEAPIIGSPDATNIIVCLFDYTCWHCRQTMPILVEAQRQLSNQLAIVCLPMPISTNCNPFLPPEGHSAPYACEYSRLGLAVWRANPKTHPEYDDWMFSTGIPPSLEDARKYAYQLAGTNQFDRALADPWVERQLLTDCRLHSTNWAAAGTPLMPQLIMGDAVSAGPINSLPQFRSLLRRYLGMEVSLNGF